MRRICATLVAGLFATAVHAQSAPAPQIAAGDRWVYENTSQTAAGWRQDRNESVVDHASEAGIAVSSKAVGSTMPPVARLVGPDWSIVRSVNGHDTVVNRPFEFPLAPGRTWTVDFTEQNPHRQHSREHFHIPYRVTGWEDVTVPAGTFHAIKVEADGDWQAAMAPAMVGGGGTRVDRQGTTTIVQTNRVAPATVSGKLYKAFWYAPDVKRYVKSVEEYYLPNGVRNEQFTSELVSYKIGG